MQAQAYRNRIVVQEKVESQDSETGDILHTWQTATLGNTLMNSVPAFCYRKQGREFDAANAKQAETPLEVKFGWRPGLLPTMRIVWQGQPFDILSIETDITDRREYRLRCREGVTDGS